MRQTPDSSPEPPEQSADPTGSRCVGSAATPEANAEPENRARRRRVKHRVEESARTAVGHLGRLTHLLGHWARPSSLHRVHPRTRAVQLGTTTLAAGLLAASLGGVGTPPNPPEAQPAVISTPLADDDSTPVQRWTANASTHTDVPPRALESYVHAAQSLSRTQPGCSPPWQLLAGVGKVESNHAQ